MLEITRIVNKNIAIACKYLHGIVGGAERNVVDTANLLARAGANVTIVVYEDKAGTPAFPLDERVRLINAWREKAFGGEPTELEKQRESTQIANDGSEEAIFWYESTRAMRLRWERALRSLRPDLVITFMPHTSTYVLEQLRTEIPVLVTNQNRPREDYWNPARHDPSPFDRKKRLENLAFARGIHVLIPEFAEEFPPLLRARIRVIPNSVPVQPFAAPTSEGKDIVAMGRLVPQKGFDILIDAMRHVAREEPEWRLHLYGRGSELENLRLRVRRASLQRNVLIRGRTAQPLAALAEGAIFVIPSEYEGWGLTLTEAMSLGVPAIGFADCSGVNWLLKDPNCGLLVKERTAGALAQAILELIRDSTKRTKLAENGRKHVLQFCPTAVENTWLQVIDEMLN